jgi:hypothetical protein
MLNVPFLDLVYTMSTVIDNRVLPFGQPRHIPENRMYGSAVHSSHFAERTPHCAVGFGCDTTSGVSLINTHNVR